MISKIIKKTFQVLDDLLDMVPHEKNNKTTPCDIAKKTSSFSKSVFKGN